MTLIIAEAGVNHNGDEALAFALVDAAHKAGADIVKFQTFKAKKLVTKTAPQADYQIENSKKAETQLSMLSRLELSFEVHHKLIKYCNKIGIEFLSTAFDMESLSFLINDLALTRLKIPSGELTNAPLVLAHAKSGCDLILSTGMATLAEIELALGVIAFGYTATENTVPSIEAFQLAYYSKQGQLALQSKVTILHCTTEYPAPMQDINLKAMDTLRTAFNLPAGYSDHSQGITIPVAAVARGACIIEKHFTLDNNMEGPDHKASLEPNELTEMITAIRNVEVALGDGVKSPKPSEIKNKLAARKSLVAATDIKLGELFTPKSVDIKRPGNGLDPSQYWSLLGKTATKEYKEGDLILE
ncbi:MAG: N-acetylneuraminate synthase [Kangiella sp.]|nr:MAG: N-acetylneuraminate synthase [Kangiella sp.]